MQKKSKFKPAQPTFNRIPWHAELEKWEKAPYDGIKGIPPKWLQAPFLNHFSRARGMLCELIVTKEATYEAIRERFEYMVKNKYGSLVLVRAGDIRSYDEHLHALVTIYTSVQLGPEEGLGRLAGDVAVAGIRARMGHQKRADFTVKPQVQKIGRAMWEANPNATIKDIIYSPELRPYLREDSKRSPGRYSAKTLRMWLSPIDPRSSKIKCGRPSRRG